MRAREDAALARVGLANPFPLADQARREGFNDLRRSALLKAAAGLTSLEEVNRVTKD